MRYLTSLSAVLALSLFGGLSLAQDTPKAEPKKEEKPAKRLDRGDTKAEKLLKKAWDRVQSAETDGLERLKTNAKITVDAKAVGRGAMNFDGHLLWKKGAKAVWNAKEDPAGGANNPMASVAKIARALFEPYLAYVTGFASFDGKFKNVNFKMGDAVKDEKGNKTGETVLVTFDDEHVETIVVAENKVVSMAREAELNGEKTKMRFLYTYEDTGKKLRLNKVAVTTKVDASAEGAEKTEGDDADSTIEGSIEIEKYGKAGEYEIAVELKGSLQLMAMDFPTKLVISDAKVNKDVSDEDLKPMEPKEEKKPEKKPEEPKKPEGEKKPDES